jgi:hypothetical protein
MLAMYSYTQNSPSSPAGHDTGLALEIQPRSSALRLPRNLDVKTFPSKISDVYLDSHRTFSRNTTEIFRTSPPAQPQHKCGSEQDLGRLLGIMQDLLSTSESYTTEKLSVPPSSSPTPRHHGLFRLRTSAPARPQRKNYSEQDLRRLLGIKHNTHSTS